MSLLARLRRAASLPPTEVAGELGRRVAGRVRRALLRRTDLARPSFMDKVADPGALASFVRAPGVEALRPFAEPLAALSSLALEHRFDLLGSGWVRVRHGMECPGLEGHRHPAGPAVAADADGAWLAGRVNAANLERCREVWRLVRPGYVPIDWQLDFRSGYRWREGEWYGDVRYGGVPGADVKVPWELARMQHLPRLALAYSPAAAGVEGFPTPDALAVEFRDQVLDFVAANPPRWGVNWTSAMDVGIRVANWLLAHDLFRAQGVAFDDAFEAVFRRSVREHGAHLWRNLERSASFRGNHYLADVVGLLFAAAYLPAARETDGWLRFAVAELGSEVRHQFLPDGANFEASTGYHRLSADLACWGTALALGVPAARLRGAGIAAAPFDGAHLGRMARMAEFLVDLTRPDGDLVQVGDNDSGSLFRLLPVVARTDAGRARRRYRNLDGFAELSDGAPYWDENVLDPRPTVAALNGVLHRDDLRAFCRGRDVETRIASSLARGEGAAPLHRSAPVRPAAAVRAGGAEAWERVRAELEGWTRTREEVFAAEGVADGLALAAYPDFGAYVFRSPRLFLAVRCGPIGQNGLGGHAHNDQLSIELVLDGADRVRDPGAYVYTPLPERRNAYRSVHAHHTPWAAPGEPASLEPGLFRLGGEARAECAYFGPAGFIGRLRSGAHQVARVVALTRGGVTVTDYARAAPPGHPPRPPVPFSPGYGRVLRGG
jgi:hypothetical protein